MAKKKKKDKKKKKEKEPEKEVSKTEAPAQPPLESSLITTLTAKKEEGDALDNAMEGTKEDHAALQSLLAGTAESDGFYRREKEEEKIQPQLQYESEDKKVVQDYLMEEVPLTERKIGRSEIKQRTKLAEPKPPSHPPSEPIDAPPVEPDEVPPEELTEEPPEGKSSVIEEPSFTQKEPESIYPRLSEFFTSLIEGNSKRYDQWEDSISSILSVLRKMRKVTKKNTEELVLSINNSYKRVQAGLEEFRLKRDEVQKVSEVDLDNLSNQFKKVLGLLELQVKEYQLKLITDEYIHSL
jgi:hypothetical protein